MTTWQGKNRLPQDEDIAAVHARAEAKALEFSQSLSELLAEGYTVQMYYDPVKGTMCLLRRYPAMVCGASPRPPHADTLNDILAAAKTLL